MRQAQTAIAVYRETIYPTLAIRHLFVHEQLVAFHAEYHYAPTSAELLRFIAQHHRSRPVDINGVRPRLTEMEKLGWVRRGTERVCDVSKKTVLTWIPRKPRPSEQQHFTFQPSIQSDKGSNY